MKKILIAEIAQEVSTFNPVQTNYDAFQVHHNENLKQYNVKVLSLNMYPI